MLDPGKSYALLWVKEMDEPNLKLGADWGLSPEEYVASLYRVILRREPDDGGFIHHVSELRQHGDPTQTLGHFLRSAEFRELEQRQRREGENYPLLKSGDDVGTLNNKMIIESSRGHFTDVSFIENVGARSDLFGRKKRSIKTVAVYYPKMSNGGTERVTSRQILAWISLGYRIILLTDVPADPRNDYPYGDVERFVVPPKMMDNQDYRPRGRELTRIFTEQGVDLFVNNLWDETSTVWDVLVAKSLDIPVVVGWHNIFDTRIRTPGDLHLANMRFSGYRYADLVTVLSTVDKIWFQDRGITARVVYNPLPFDVLPATVAPLTGKTIIWVARAERHQKRLDLAIRMFPLVLEKVPGARLLIVGDGPDLEWAKEYADSLGIAASVEFVGYTTDVAKHLARSDIHILTSEFEGWCLALGEAWAYGLPTVMFDLPYLEYVQSGRGYIPVKMGDVSAMAAAVTRLLLDAALRQELGREAREVAEEFDQVSVTEEWRKIFADIETADSLATPLAPDVELRGRRALDKVLGDRFLELEGNFREKVDNYVPVLPSQARPRRPKRKTHRHLLQSAQVVASPFVAAKRAITRALVPDRRLKMIDLSHVGLGDNLMIWTGLFTLLSNGVPICAPGCSLHVQPILGDLATRLFAQFGLLIQRGQPEKQRSPIYTPLPPRNMREWWDTYVGRDWRMNWVEALDQQKTFPREGQDLSFKARMRLALSERFLYRRHSWAEATPGYVGYRVWLPLARRHGVYPLMFLSQLKRSLGPIRRIIADYVDEITPVDDRGAYSGSAAFPVGKSFQTIPPKVFRYVNDALGNDYFKCCIQQDSPWRHDYEAARIMTRNFSDIKDTFRTVKYAKSLLATDSFTSHFAQLLRDDFVLVLSRDMQESIVHPGAHPKVVANHPACAPCNYQERSHFDRCVAGYRYCLAFESGLFAENIVAAVRGQEVERARFDRAPAAVRADGGLTVVR